MATYWYTDPSKVAKFTYVFDAPSSRLVVVASNPDCSAQVMQFDPITGKVALLVINPNYAASLGITLDASGKIALI